MKPDAKLDAMLADREIIVCVGCGGAGKTTVAAALALEAARRGRKALVLTIDPARRLADALGVESLGNRPQAIPRETLDALDVPQPGNLSAVMLDMKRTFDDLVERFAESAEVRNRIFENSIYQHVSNALAGSVEYSAMEKVFELHESGAFDLIVVDTPPAQHALEFLDSRLVKMLIHPAFAAGRFGFRLFHLGTQRVLRVLERITGIRFLEDLSEFLIAFDAMAIGFRDRAHRVQSLLLGPESTFVLVSGRGARHRLPRPPRGLRRLARRGAGEPHPSLAVGGPPARRRCAARRRRRGAAGCALGQRGRRLSRADRRRSGGESGDEIR